jgi:hypothetical protein
MAQHAARRRGEHLPSHGLYLTTDWADIGMRRFRRNIFDVGRAAWRVTITACWANGGDV